MSPPFCRVLIRRNLQVAHRLDLGKLLSYVQRHGARTSHKYRLRHQRVGSPYFTTVKNILYKNIAEIISALHVKGCFGYSNFLN